MPHDDITRTRAILRNLIVRLEQDIADGPDAWEKHRAYWGEKENAVSVLTKLSTMLLKLVPLEEKTVKTELETNIAPLQPLREEDKEILRRYLEWEEE